MAHETTPFASPVKVAEGVVPPAGRARPVVHPRVARWAVTLGAGVAVWLAPLPAGVEPKAWHLFSIFLATVVGLVAQPVPVGCVVLLGVIALALSGTMTIQQALAGYADPIIWLVLTAFCMARAMIKTGLGRRIAFVFIRSIGHRTIGLGYALVATDFLLGSFIPSNGARAGGIVFPIASSLARAYDSEPGPSARRLGAFLMTLIYQCDVVICATFLTGQASNVLIARFSQQATGFEITYASWLLGAIVPSLVCLALVPLLLYRIYPPDVRRTPEATEIAQAELARMGPVTRAEKLTLAVFLMVAALWMSSAFHGMHYTLVALVGLAALLLSGVLAWDDFLSERSGFDVFIWYGGIVLMADALGKTPITRHFAEASAAFTVGWPWWQALALLVLIYFYAHYAFASITAHSTAMYLPFAAVVLGAGAPPAVAALVLAYSSNLCAALTHYGTTPAPILFGAGYTSQRTWWRLGLVISVPTLLVFSLVGPLWWKVLGWW